MAENLIIVPSASKEEKYKALLPQVEALVSGETDLIANLSNIAASLKQTFGFFWVGFYIVRPINPPSGPPAGRAGDKGVELVLGPFQGPIACTRIGFGKGVCGTCWKEKKTIIVPNVDDFPGHIACASESKSEIVVPLIRLGEVKLVLDVDSDRFNSFDLTDQHFLESIIDMIK